MCQFSIPFTSNADALINRAKQEITSSGGFFEGNAFSGNFRVKTVVGSIEGSYQIEANEIAISISKKPLLVSCSKIEKELKGVMV